MHLMKVPPVVGCICDGKHADRLSTFLLTLCSRRPYLTLQMRSYTADNIDFSLANILKVKVQSLMQLTKGEYKSSRGNCNATVRAHCYVGYAKET
jgi:hypothetical protein